MERIPTGLLVRENVGDGGKESGVVSDSVNHPSHYNSSPAKCEECGKNIECITIVRHMSFNLGNAIKYIWRAGLKPGQTDVQDLEKAVWYLQDEIERRKNGKG
jgi:hypothetical protein